MSVYEIDPFLNEKHLKKAKEVKKETDNIKFELMSTLKPVAYDLLYELIGPEIEKAVKKGHYSCIVALPRMYVYPNKYELEIEEPEMQIICELITKWLSETLDYKVICIGFLMIEISWDNN